MPLRKKSLSRNDLMDALLTESVSNDKQLCLLEKKNFEELLDVISESFVEDPFFVWGAGLDENIVSDSKRRKDLQLRYNRSLSSWSNRPILVGKKGIVMGIKADEEEDSPLAGAISITPGRPLVGFVDTISNLITIGLPPILTREKVHYGPNGDKRMKSMIKMEKKRSELMKESKSNYIYIESVGVLSEHRGKGFGGKLIRTICELADSHSIPLYLETNTKKNESLYHHFGFQTVEIVELEAEGTPTKLKMWLMVRSPKQKKTADS